MGIITDKEKNKMEYQLLYSFLKSGKNQKDFAKEHGISGTAMGAKLHKQLRKIRNTTIINIDDYLLDPSTLIVNVKQSAHMWIKAIEAYNEVINSLPETSIDNRKLMDLTISEFKSLMISILNSR